jgi:prepilin-type processing-associated H-X9-DG protein
MSYVDNFGVGRYYPYASAGGTATLSLLYNEGVRLLKDPRAFICPSTTDSTCTQTTLTNAVCSYIGRRADWGAVQESTTDTRMAGDDSIGHGNNHTGGANMLFLDGHVEFVVASEFPVGPPLHVEIP